MTPDWPNAVNGRTADAVTDPPPLAAMTPCGESPDASRLSAYGEESTG
jgi:hypothetical protein